MDTPMPNRYALGTMASRPSTHSPRLLRRFTRPDWLRAALAVVMVPIMVIGIFGGTTILAHSHDGHHTHVHAAPSKVAARIVADLHKDAHRIGARCDLDAPRTAHADEPHEDPPADPGCPSHAPEGPDSKHAPDDTVVLIPDVEQIVVRAGELAAELKLAVAIAIDHLRISVPPVLSDQIGSPGGHASSAPWHLRALTAAQRLIRTSQALLI